MQGVDIGLKDTIVNKSAGYGVTRGQPRSSDSRLPNQRRERQEPKSATLTIQEIQELQIRIVRGLIWDGLVLLVFWREWRQTAKVGEFVELEELGIGE